MLQTPRGSRRGRNEESGISHKRMKLDFSANLPTVNISTILTDHSYYKENEKLPDDYLKFFNVLLTEEIKIKMPDSWYCRRDYAGGSVSFYYIETMQANATSEEKRMFLLKEVAMPIDFFDI